MSSKLSHLEAGHAPSRRESWTIRSACRVRVRSRLAALREIWIRQAFWGLLFVAELRGTFCTWKEIDVKETLEGKREEIKDAECSEQRTNRKSAVAVWAESLFRLAKDGEELVRVVLELFRQLTETWKTPHLLIGGYAERTAETNACLEEMWNSIRSTDVSSILEIAFSTRFR